MLGLIIGIAGGSGSGKSSVVHLLRKHYGKYNVAYLPQDAYYNDHSHVSMEERKNINFDHPDAIEFPLLKSHIEDLQDGVSVERPVYSFMNCTRSEKTVHVHASEIVIVEGLFILTDESVRESLDAKIFVELDMMERLDRLITRDVKERGRDEREVKKRFLETVQPMHEEFIEPFKQHADLVVDGLDTQSAARKIIDHVKRT